MKRSNFIKTVGGTSLLIAATPLYSFSNATQDDPPLDPELVKVFVGKSHSDMETVQAMLEEFPTLLNAAHDWKYGDFETGLGAASHVGYKALAQYFLDKGAQANVFTAALFGKLDIVKPMLEAFPATLHARGPHGFSLLHHAERGGDDAVAVVEYLASMGATEKKYKIY